MGTFPAPKQPAVDNRLSEEEVTECGKWLYKSLLQNFKRTWEPEKKQQRILFSANHTIGQKYECFTDSEENAEKIITKTNQKLAADGWTITDWGIEHHFEYKEQFRGKTKINLVLSKDYGAIELLGKAIDSSSRWDCLHEFQNGTKIMIRNNKILIQGNEDFCRTYRYESRDKKIENKSNTLRFSETKNIEPFNEGYEGYFNKKRRLVIYMEHNGEKENT